MHLTESLDGVLLVNVSLIFTIGINILFIPDLKILRNVLIPWLDPKNFSDLKQILWEAVSQPWSF